jgi:hypothetical protein
VHASGAAVGAIVQTLFPALSRTTYDVTAGKSTAVAKMRTRLLMARAAGATGRSTSDDGANAASPSPSPFMLRTLTAEVIEADGKVHEVTPEEHSTAPVESSTW